MFLVPNWNWRKMNKTRKMKIATIKSYFTVTNPKKSKQLLIHRSQLLWTSFNIMSIGRYYGRTNICIYTHIIKKFFFLLLGLFFVILRYYISIWRCCFFEFFVLQKKYSVGFKIVLNTYKKYFSGFKLSSVNFLVSLGFSTTHVYNIKIKWFQITHKGAVMFGLSDTLLCYREFVADSGKYKNFFVMLTYYLAQLGMALSVIDTYKQKDISSVVPSNFVLAKKIKLDETEKKKWLWRFSRFLYLIFYIFY